MMNGREIKIQSIHNMMALLVKIESEPKKFMEDDDLISTISSQSSLAKASLQKEDKYESIYPMALNTQKSLCRLEFIEGYKKLDEQRLKAVAAIRNAKNEGKEHRNRRTFDDSELVKQLTIVNSHYSILIDQLRGELKKALLSRPENPERALENINKIINLKLKHVNITKKG